MTQSPNDVPWPEQAFPFSDVQTWVTSALNLPSEAVDIAPVAVYVAYTTAPDLRVTARLSVTQAAGKTDEVVFKANRFPLLAASARAHALVSRHGAGRVPHVLAWEDGDGGEARLLYTPFEGRSVGELCVDDPALLEETARTLAEIQKAVLDSGEAGSAGLASVRVEDVPALFEAVYEHIGAHAAAWATDTGGKLSEWLRFPAADVLGILETIRPQVIRCAERVAALDLPLTIHHGDLHGGNAIIQTDGTILIHDWETATLSCPLFSMDKLLVSAWSRDRGMSGGGPWGYMPGTPTQNRVRNAYLEAHGWVNVGAGAFTAALCLAVIQEMHTEIVWAMAMGWADGNPEWTAQLISRLRYHLQALGRNIW